MPRVNNKILPPLRKRCFQRVGAYIFLIVLILFMVALIALDVAHQGVTSITCKVINCGDKPRHRVPELNENDNDAGDSVTARPLLDRVVGCVHDILRLDEHDRSPVHPRNVNNAIPLMVVPVMNDAENLPDMFCSIDAPVRYLYVVLNERDPLALSIVNALDKAFGMSGRVIIQRNEVNAGYAGSMNQGLRWGMEQRGNDEVPWVLLSNCDVKFKNKILTSMVAAVTVLIANDTAVLRDLRAEVQMEEQLARSGNLSYYHKWAPQGRPLHVLRSGYPGVPPTVQTAPLLPDRIRYMYENVNHEEGESFIVSEGRYFSKHYGMIFPVYESQSCVAVTRLMTSTVGYIDENFYPAYFEDIDWRWRMFSLGFKIFSLKTTFMSNYFYHKNGGNFFTGPVDHLTEDNSPVIRYHMSLERKGIHYRTAKFGNVDQNKCWGEVPHGSSNPFVFFNISRYPIDVWVRDPNHFLCFYKKTYSYATKQWHRPTTCPYNTDVISESGILGELQVAQSGSA